MPRLIDEFLTAKRVFGPRDSRGQSHLDGGKLKQLRQSIGAAEVIVADNVSRYYFEVDPRNVIEIRDFPNIAPPFRTMWIEARSPQKKNIGGILSPLEGKPASYGMFVQSYRANGGGWLMLASVFAQFKNQPPCGPLGTLVVRCDDQGAFDYIPAGEYELFGKKMRFEDPYDGQGIPTLSYIPVSDPLAPVFIQASIDTAKPLFMALTFMHCKNVRSEVVDPPLALSRKWQRKTGRALVRYRQLDIEPMREVLRRDGGVEVHGIGKALHICRGHFATYTDEAPLFGRVTGTFWKEQHVRGSAKHGAVVKDYNVKAPR